MLCDGIKPTFGRFLYSPFANVNNLILFLQPILTTQVSKWFLEYILIKYTMFRIAVPYKNHMYHVELTDIEVNDS